MQHTAQIIRQDSDYGCVAVIREIGAAVSKLRNGVDLDQRALLFGTLDELLNDQLALQCWNSPVWNEFMSLAASGRILSATAQAGANYWFSSGPEYVRWLGRCILALLSTGAETPASQICHKALMLGYSENMVEPLLDRDDANLLLLVNSVSGLDQRKILYSILSYQNKMLQNGSMSVDEIRNNISSLLSSSTIGSILATWLTKDLHSAHIDLYRTIITVIAGKNEILLNNVLETNWDSFGDKLGIRHIPIIRQEANVQVLLLAAGCMHRQNPSHLLKLARSATHTAAISNRLASSSPRIRFLGMIVGETISTLVDKPDSRLTFGHDELNTNECQWYRSLVLQSLDNERQTRDSKTVVELFSPTTVTTKTFDVQGDGEDNDLETYSKPANFETEDEDPTIVQHNRAKPPRYIRDLATNLNNSEDYETNRLAIMTAAALIRRKANFGAELRDRCEELALILLGLNNIFQIENFQEFRSSALISLVIAEPQRMGPWFASNYFSGDYSISQRALILTAMGMGARELAGFAKDNGNSGSARTQSLQTQFPSEVLPARIHAMYASEFSPLQSLAGHLEDSMITPLAVDAADSLIGPNIFKIRKFSSRLSLDKSKNAIKANTSTIPDSFFFPLIGHWSSQLPSNFSSPHLLPLFLKTLGIILISCGRTALALPSMTMEFWILVLSVRSRAHLNQPIMEAVLFSLLAIITVNEDKIQLVQNYAKQLVETHEWVDLIFANLDEHDDDSSKSRSLAASILLQTAEILESQQRLLLGDIL